MAVPKNILSEFPTACFTVFSNFSLFLHYSQTHTKISTKQVTAILSYTVMLVQFSALAHSPPTHFPHPLPCSGQMVFQNFFKEGTLFPIPRPWQTLMNELAFSISSSGVFPLFFHINK